MKTNNLIKFEPVDLTKIITYFVLCSLVIIVFHRQLNEFFDTLSDRKITVQVDKDGTMVTLDRPVKPGEQVQFIKGVGKSTGQLETWNHGLMETERYKMLEKEGFFQLEQGMDEIDNNELTVINFEVNDPGIMYFEDKDMLRYLEKASEKISYISFYQEGLFVGAIDIDQVIYGLANDVSGFTRFGHKLKHGMWKNFPGLVTNEQSFSEIPTIKQLYERLQETGHDVIPLILDGKLHSLLTYKTVSEELYEQAKNSANVPREI